MATVLKVNRDWERIADLALRVARRARKLSRSSSGVAMPEALKQLAGDVLAQVRSCSNALAKVDAAAGPDRDCWRQFDRCPVPRPSKGTQSPDEPASRAARRLAPASEHGAESRANRRSCGRYRPDHRLSQGGGHHPAHAPGRHASELMMFRTGGRSPAHPGNRPTLTPEPHHADSSRSSGPFLGASLVCGESLVISAPSCRGPCPGQGRHAGKSSTSGGSPSGRRRGADSTSLDSCRSAPAPQADVLGQGA